MVRFVLLFTLIFGVFQTPTARAREFSEIVVGAATNQFSDACDANAIAPRLLDDVGIQNRNHADTLTCASTGLPRVVADFCRNNRTGGAAPNLLCFTPRLRVSGGECEAGDLRAECQIQQPQRRQSMARPVVCFLDPSTQVVTGQNLRADETHQPRFRGAFILTNSHSSQSEVYQLDRSGCNSTSFSNSMSILSGSRTSNDATLAACTAIYHRLRGRPQSIEEARVLEQDTTDARYALRTCAQGEALEPGWAIDEATKKIGECSRGFPFLGRRLMAARPAAATAVVPAAPSTRTLPGVRTN